MKFWIFRSTSASIVMIMACRPARRDLGWRVGGLWTVEGWWGLAWGGWELSSMPVAWHAWTRGCRDKC